MKPDVEGIARLLLGGGVAVLPTDTIYGYHCLANDKSAVARIASIKERDDARPFLVLGDSIAQFEELGARFTAGTRIALEELWPGPLTAIVPIAQPIAASRGLSSIGVRVPAVNWLRDLLKLTGPLASTSMNRSGQPSLVSPADLSQEMLDAVDAIVDGGTLDGKSSAIVDFTGDEPQLIREGEDLFTQKVWKTLRKSL